MQKHFQTFTCNGFFDTFVCKVNQCNPGVLDPTIKRPLSISEIQVTRVDLVHDIGDILVITVSQNHIGNPLKLIKVAYYSTVEESILSHSGLVDNYLNAFGLNAFHHTLDGGLAEIIRAGLHCQAVNTHDLRLPMCRDKVTKAVLSLLNKRRILLLYGGNAMQILRDGITYE